MPEVIDFEPLETIDFEPIDFEPVSSPPPADTARLERGRQLRAELDRVRKESTVTDAERVRETLFNAPVRGMSSLATGALDWIASGAKVIGEKRPIEELDTYKAARFIEENVADSFLRQPVAMKEDLLGSKLPEALGQGAGFIGAGAALKSATAVPAMLGAMVQGSAGYKEAIQSGATEDDAFMAWLLNSGVGLSEAVPISRMINRLEKGAGGGLRKAIVDAGIESIEETIQEGVQGLAGNAIAQQIYDENRGLFDGVQEQAGIGALAGGTLSGVVSTINGIRKPKTATETNQTETEEQAIDFEALESEVGEGIDFNDLESLGVVAGSEQTQAAEADTTPGPVSTTPSFQPPQMPVMTDFITPDLTESEANQQFDAFSKAADEFDQKLDGWIEGNSGKPILLKNKDSDLGKGSVYLITPNIGKEGYRSTTFTWHKSGKLMPWGHIERQSVRKILEDENLLWGATRIETMPAEVLTEAEINAPQTQAQQAPPPLATPEAVEQAAILQAEQDQAAQQAADQARLQQELDEALAQEQSITTDEPGKAPARGTITGSNERKGSEMPADSGATPGQQARPEARPSVASQMPSKASIRRRIRDLRASINSTENVRKKEQLQSELAAAQTTLARLPDQPTPQGLNVDERPPDLIDWIKDNFGGIKGKKHAKNKGDNQYSKNLYQDAMRGSVRNIVGNYPHDPDVVAQGAYDAGLIEAPTADALWAGASQASAQRGEHRKKHFAEQRRLKEDEKAAVEFDRFALNPRKRGNQKPEALNVGELTPGDEFHVDGTKFVVREFTFKPDSDQIDSVIVEDGPRFGVQEIDADNNLWIDKNSLKQSPEIDFVPAEDQQPAPPAPTREPTKPRQVTEATLPTGQDANTVTWFHGSNATITSPASSFTRIDGLFGSGFYLTDDPEIALSYAKARSRSNGSGVLHSVSVTIDKTLNMERPLPPDAANAITSAVYQQFKEGVQADVAAGKSAAEVWRNMADAVQDESQGEMVPISEYYEMFYDIEVNLRMAGYDALTHIGGTRAGKGEKLHRVLIVLDPSNEMMPVGHEKRVVSSVEATSISKADEIDQKIKAARREATEAYKDLAGRASSGVDPVALFKYYKALGKLAKAYFEKGILNARDWAKAMGARYTAFIQKVWDDHIHGTPAESAKELAPGLEQGTRTRERSFSKRVAGDDRIHPLIQAQTDGINYPQIPNNVTAAEARAVVDQHPDPQQALIALMNKGNGMVERVRVMFGQQLILKLNEQFKQTGDQQYTDMAVQAAEWLAEWGTTMGQGVQAFAAFGRLTPDGYILALQKGLNKLKEQQTKGKSEQWKAANRDKLPKLDPKVQAEIRNMADHALKQPAGFQRDEAIIDVLNRISQELKRQGSTTANLAEIAWSVWYANILSGWSTQVLNVMSTLVNVFKEATALIVQNPKDTGAVLGGFLHGLPRGMRDAAALMKSGKLTGTRVYKLEFGGPLEQLGNWNPVGWMKFVHRFMAAQDLVFFRTAEEMFASTLATHLARDEGLKGRDLAKRVDEILYKTPELRAKARTQAKAEGLTANRYHRRVREIMEQARPERITQRAADFGRYATFNNQPYGVLGIAAKLATTGSRRFPPLRLLVPFTNIVSNVFNQMLDITPYGFIRQRRQKILDELGIEKGTEEWRQMGARAMVGTLGMSALAAMALKYFEDDDPEFMIYGNGPSDRRKGYQLRETGWRPNTVKIGDRYYNYMTTPAGMGLSIIGNYLDAIRYDRLGEEEASVRLAHAIRGAGKSMLEMSFLRGISDFVKDLTQDGVKRNNPFGRFANTIVGGAFPNLIKQIEDIFNPTIYKAHDLRSSLLRQTPVVRHRSDLLPLLNVLGEPVQRDRAQRFVSPKINDPVWTMIANKQAWISDPLRSADFPDRPMTVNEEYQYVKISGPAIRRRLEMELPLLNVMSNEEAKKRVSQIVTQERKEAKEQIRFMSGGL